MNYLQKIIIDFELHSVEGIKECFENGVNPNEIVKDKPLIYELINMYSRGPLFKECIKVFVDYGLVFDDKVLLSVLLDNATMLDTQLTADKKEITICEIGCGGGDNLAAIAKALSKDISLKFIGIDIKQECIDFAKQDPNNSYIVEWITSDYRNVSFTKKPDIIFSSLFCHHFTEDLLKEQLKWMKENSTIGFFINDLHRHPFAYYSIKLITSIFSNSYLVKNDAPLSVARGFKKIEWKNILFAAGINNYTIQWKWAFRHLILYMHERK